MKSLLILSLLGAAFFLTGCDAVVVERHHGYSGGYYAGGYHGRRHHDTVVVVDRPGYYRRPAPYYGGPARVVYYTDKHGRYYWRQGHKVYVARW